jgi:hypothetical protein
VVSRDEKDCQTCVLTLSFLEMCFLCHTGNAEWECRDKLYCTGCIENETSLDDRKDLTNKNIIQLYAIICINSAHYTVFVKCKDSESDWFYFDSMAGSYPEVKVGFF